MEKCCWVIKVTYLKTGEVNFNEAYWTLEKCLGEMIRKIEPENYRRINKYTMQDLDKELEYEAKLIDIF